MPRRATIAEAELQAVLERRGLQLPTQNRHLRSIGMFFEVRERFADDEPATHDLVRRWMRGGADRKGKPSGLQFTADLAKLLGFASGRALLDETVLDHFFPRSHLPTSQHGKISNLFICETAFNLSEEWKLRSLSKKAFFGTESYNTNVAWLKWQFLNPDTSSLLFFHSSANTAGGAPIYASSKLRASGMTRAVADTPGLATDDEDEMSIQASLPKVSNRCLPPLPVSTKTTRGALLDGAACSV